MENENLSLLLMWKHFWNLIHYEVVSVVTEDFYLFMIIFSNILHNVLHINGEAHSSEDLIIWSQNFRRSCFWNETRHSRCMSNHIGKFGQLFEKLGLKYQCFECSVHHILNRKANVFLVLYLPICTEMESIGRLLVTPLSISFSNILL